MIDRLMNWFKQRFSAEEEPPAHALEKSGAHVAPQTQSPQKKVPRKNPEFVDADEDLSSEIESSGPGKNVLIRNKYVREETGTHETLKILDDSLVDSGEETGIDPYNTGGFDRSKNWDKRFSK